MANLEWKYVSPLKNCKELDDLELKYLFRLPDDLKECIEEHNAGVPSLSTFNLRDNKDMVFGGLLSYNEGDVDSFYDYVSIFEKDNGKRLKMFPFALDPAGNFFCIENNKVVLYCHETDEIVEISETFSDFLKMLF